MLFQLSILGTCTDPKETSSKAISWQRKTMIVKNNNLNSDMLIFSSITLHNNKFFINAILLISLWIIKIQNETEA